MCNTSRHVIQRSAHSMLRVVRDAGGLLSSGYGQRRGKVSAGRPRGLAGKYQNLYRRSPDLSLPLPGLHMSIGPTARSRGMTLREAQWGVRGCLAHGSGECDVTALRLRQQYRTALCPYQSDLLWLSAARPHFLTLASDTLSRAPNAPYLCLSEEPPPVRPGRQLRPVRIRDTWHQHPPGTGHHSRERASAQRAVPVWPT